MGDEIRGEKKGPIFYLTLNRPEKRNAITFDMLAVIAEMVEDLITNADIRVILLRGEGPVFSAGVDFPSLAGLVDRFLKDSAAGGASIRADIARYQQYLNRLETIEIPILCALHGRVLGLGMELVLPCDIRLMSDDCIWGMPELKFGTIPDLGGTARLTRVVGAAKAMEILMTGRMYPAAEALRLGLVNGIFPARDLMAEAEKMATEIAGIAPLAVGAVKRVVRKGEGVDLMTHLDMEANLQSILLRSEDFREGVSSMMERRPPNWRRR